MSNNPTIADLEHAWATTPNLKIRKSDAEGALKSLNSHKSFTHINFSSKNGFKSRYLTDMIAKHRRQLEMMLLLNNTEYDTDKYRMYKGIVYSWDLSMVPGLWKVPFSFTFDNLIILNLDLCTALYWAIPIITATSSNNFRWLIIQRINDLRVTAFPFPFTELDHCLVVRPLLKVILVYCEQECTTIFRREMPLLNFGSNLKFLKEPAIDDNLDSNELTAMADMPHAYTFEPEDDPYGVGSLFQELADLGDTKGNPIVVES